MGKRLKGWLLILCVFVIGLSVINTACADIPSGVKDHYEYNQTDRSIVKVKKRLQELGYFGKSAQFSDTVSEDLKKAVIAFQEQNAVMADGVIDKDFLELLFSDDAVEKGGKPKTKTTVVTEKSAETEESNAASARTTTQNKESKEEKKSDTVTVFLIIGVPVVVFILIILIYSSVRKSKDRVLVEIIERYKELRQDERCKKAIKEAGIVVNILASGGEYFLIPLIYDGARYKLRFDRNAVLNAEKECGTSIITMLDGIAREGSLREEANRKLCNIWGAWKNGKVGGSFGAEEYKKTMYLFTSLVSSGIIRENDEVTRDAFLFLVWECALDENIRLKSLVEDNVKKANQIALEYDDTDHYGTKAFAKSKKVDGIADAYQNAVYILYETLDQKAETITLMMTAKEYIENGKTMWHTIYVCNQKDVEAVISEIEKRRYVNNLLQGSGKPRVNIQTTDSMSPAAFEELVAVLFNKMGYNAKTTKLSGDQGVDVVADKKGIRIVIQAKCYKNSVGNAAVQEVVAGKEYYHASEAYVVTNSTFTKSAVMLAKANNVVLCDRSGLAQMLDRYSVYVSEIHG